MKKVIKLDKEAREALFKGIEVLSNTVSATLGPSGRNVVIEQDMGQPASTKDGVTVAKAVHVEDVIENIGVEMVREVAIKTAKEAGDGTTTSTVLAHKIVADYLSENSDVPDSLNLVDVRKGLEKATEDVLNYIRENIVVDITDEEQLKQIATISANNDEQVGKLIALAMDKVGVDGVITVEESKSGETYLDTVEGIQFSRGFSSPYFVVDNKSMTTTLDKPSILITDKNLQNVNEILPLLQSCSTQNKSLLIIADNVGGEALSTLVVNKMKGILKVVAVKAPEFGDRKKDTLEDIATLTGGKVVSFEKGMRLDNFQPEWLGEANKVVVGKDTTTIVDALGEEEDINRRVEEIKHLIDQTKSPYEKEKLQERLAKFVGGVAVVNVGGHTELELKERKDRVEDALYATKAAVEEGIVPGGGVALLRAAETLGKTPQQSDNESFNRGYATLLKACIEPAIRILKNTGKEYAHIEEILYKVYENEEVFSGYNPRTEEYENFSDSGVIDPFKVTRLALQNAVSVAGTVITTQAVISKNQDTEQVDPMSQFM